MRFSRISRVSRVSLAGKVWVSAVAATAVAGGLVALLVTGGGDGGGGNGDSASADGAQRTAIALTRFRTASKAGPSEVTVRLPSAGGGAVTVRAVADYRVHRAVGVYEVMDGDHIMRGLLAWDLEGVAVAGSPVTAPDDASGHTARPAAPGPVTTAVQAARRASALTPGQWKRRPYGNAPLDQALQLALSVAADRPADQHSWSRADGPAIHPTASARPRPTTPPTYSLDTAGDLRRITARVALGREATVDFTSKRVRTGVPGAPWEGRLGRP
ncbi:hypothetical protein [Streptomyces sp. NBC_00038]|uniref:hypothetical protein n=1 Tax=Streptomyces sp. NBC_00038 TaxID=2903615 RepID=UPI002258A98B|nr:hypothetical protein [Streptomyces sp. NBC_00038]MCX5559203.1 hypothetical protein [Streptomyces sp. NBC_00038]